MVEGVWCIWAQLDVGYGARQVDLELRLLLRRTGPGSKVGSPWGVSGTQVILQGPDEGVRVQFLE